MSPFSFILDFPTSFSFYIALSIFITFIIFVSIILYMGAKDMAITIIKGAFISLTFFMILPFILSFDTIVSKNTKDIKMEELNAYKEQFNLISYSNSEKYYVIYKETKFYDFKSLVFILDKNEDEKQLANEISKFKDICFEKEDVNISCSLEYDSNLYNLSKLNFNRIFSFYDDKLTIKYHRLEDKKGHELDVFDYKKEPVYSENQDIDLFLNNLNNKGINVSKLEDNSIDLTVIEGHSPVYTKEINLNELNENVINLTIKEDFPLAFKKYEDLLSEVELLNSKKDYQLNIKFNNIELNNEKIKNELKKRNEGDN